MRAKRTFARIIFYYFAALVLIMAMSIGFSSYYISSNQLKKQNEQHLTEIVSNAVNQTDLYLKVYERAHLSLLSNSSIKQFLDNPPIGDYENYRYTENLMNSVIYPLFIKSPEIMKVYLSDYNNHRVYFENPALKSLVYSVPSFTFAELDKEVDPQGGMTIISNSVFIENNNQLITLARKIHGEVFDEFKGILAIEITTNEFAKLWKGINLGENGFFAIADKNGRIVYHPDKQRIGTTLTPDLLSKIEENDHKAFKDDSFGENRMIVSSKSAYTGWNLIVSIPMSDINEPLSSIRTSSFWVAGITLLIALIISYQFGRKIAKPIQFLKNGMRQTEKGNWVKIPQLKSNNELDELIHRYNLMVVSLSDLMDTLYRTELSKKDAELERQKAELQSLQLQINPHFLYNTLENIIVYAVIQQSTEITEIVDAIASMFRYSIQNNIEETAIVNELKHVLNYMTIMKHRVGREFELDVRIPPGYFLKKTARLTLQPLIENIFQHGFADGIEAHHFIRLDAFLEDDDLVIVLEDNGVGMTAEKLATLNKKLSANQLAEANLRKGSGNSGGIGLMNVHRRIQLLFGEQYGLSIESEFGRGTKIYMRFPDIAT